MGSGKYVWRAADSNAGQAVGETWRLPTENPIMSFFVPAISASNMRLTATRLIHNWMPPLAHEIASTLTRSVFITTYRQLPGVFLTAPMLLPSESTLSNKMSVARRPLHRSQDCSPFLLFRPTQYLALADACSQSTLLPGLPQLYSQQPVLSLAVL